MSSSLSRLAFQGQSAGTHNGNVGTAVDLTDLSGAAIRERRTFLRISQEELAVRSGLHRTYLSDVERGARNPSIKTIEKIAQALHVPVVKLFEDRQPSSKME
jgi:transcriptional regulator with XRE-family HTH domain